MALLRRNRDRGADGEPRPVPRKDRRGARPVVVGLLLIALVAFGTFLGFTKDIPFTKPYTQQAVFANANSIRKNSPVRIAGVLIGKVKKVERYRNTDASVITFSVNKAGLPIHKDATAKIRPRIFLEGNFFIDLRPGTPAAPVLGAGDPIPMAQTASPVQFGDVLSALQADTRKNLQNTLQGLGRAFTIKPNAADDAKADPDTRGQTAAQSLNDNYDKAGPAFRYTSIVNEALLGTDEHDLSGVIQGLAKITSALDRNGSQLQDFVQNFNATMRIFAQEQGNLRSTIRELPPTLKAANRTFVNLNRAFPSVRAFSREILPGVRETPATIEASFPFIRQTRKLLGQSELRGLVRELSPATRDLARTIDATTDFLPEQDLLSKCLDRVILPTGDVKIQDGAMSTDRENYKEFWYAMVGLAGEGQNFDGNGMYVRFNAGGGTQTVSTGSASLSGEKLFGRNDKAPIGNRPAYPGKRPPVRPDVPCFTNKLPDLNGAAVDLPDKSAPSSDTPGAGGILGGGAGSGITVPGTGITVPTPTLPTLPPVPGVTGKKRSAPASDDVAGQILDRLNPFREGGNGK